MRPIVCKDCGKVFEGERKDDPCPRCVAIDMLVPGPSRTDTPSVAIPFAVVPRRPESSGRHRVTTDEPGKASARAYVPPSQVDDPPPPVVIPGPASSLANTLQDTKGPPPEIERRAAPPNRILEIAERLGAHPL